VDEASLESVSIGAESSSEIFSWRQGWGRFAPTWGPTSRALGGKIATFVLGRVDDLAVDLDDADFSEDVDLNSRDGWVSNLDTLILGWIQVPEAVAGPVC